MMNANDCRDESLELVLTADDSDPNFNAVVQHLSDCVTCQRRLDDLAARPSWWKDVRRHLAVLPETVVPELPAISTLVTAQIEDTAVLPMADVASYLQPPRHPEMMGRIGKYEVEREIGRGGMGIVLKGFDSELNRPVAIKLLSPHLATSGIARQRFVREARAAAAVVHENVVAIHGIETSGTLPSIVMPFISGVSLQQFIDSNGPLEAMDVVRIGIQIAAGLAAAHQQGLVHRDIKPGNIMLENSINRIQITDFGLARAAHDANLTRSGIIAGTPSFMAPEQALSESVDQRSDLFSLGSVLYFAATGVLPFRASTPIGVMQQVCSATPTSPREVNAMVPELLESVIEKLQSKSPDDRFQTANDVKRYLNDYLAYLQQPTTRKAPHQLATPTSKRRRNTFWLRATAVSMLLAAVVATAAMTWRPPKPTPSPLVTAGPTGPGPAVIAEPKPMVSLPTMSQIDAEISLIDNEIRQLENQQSWTFSGFGGSDFDTALMQLQHDFDAAEAVPFNADLLDPRSRAVQSLDATLRTIESGVQNLEHSPNQ